MFYLLIILIQMKILLNNQMLYKAIKSLNSIGFVPTMGGIHKGHISLINKSKKNCKKTLVSIFINPKQFNNKNDFKKYPSDINKDLYLLKKTKKVDFVYIPEFKDIYKSKRKSEITIKKKDKRIFIINNKINLGAGHSRNEAIKIAKGKYLAFCDSDDLWESNKIQNQLNFMQKKI